MGHDSFYGTQQNRRIYALMEMQGAEIDLLEADLKRYGAFFAAVVLGDKALSLTPTERESGENSMAHQAIAYAKERNYIEPSVQIKIVRATMREELKQIILIHAIWGKNGIDPGVYF